MPLPTDIQLEDLRKSIKKRFLDRGWDSLNGIDSSVNHFGDYKKTAKVFYSKSIVIHPPYFFNSYVMCRKKNYTHNNSVINDMWYRNPEKMDRYILEIIMDVVIDFIKTYDFHPGYEQIIIFQHYGTEEYNVDVWMKEQREYHINVKGNIRRTS